MALISQLSNVTLASIDEDALLLRLTTAEATVAGAHWHLSGLHPFVEPLDLF